MTMKYCLPIMLLAAVSCAANHEDRYLGQTDFSLNQKVTCLSEGREKLWIGTESGSMASFDPISCRYSDPVGVGSGQVYCIRELSGDTLLVGVRDSGLKLVKADESSAGAELLTQFVLSGEKGTNYSPYSFLVKRQKEHYSRQSGFRCDTIFCGTSNGLYWLPLEENTELGDTVRLRKICGAGEGGTLRMVSLAEKSGDIYAGGPAGLLRVLNPEAEEEADRYVKISDVGISHVSVRGDVLQILDSDGGLYMTEAMHKVGRRFGTRPLLFFSDGRMDFALSEYEVEMRDPDGNSGTFRLNGKAAICSGQSDRGRECFVKKGDFYYVATSSGICRIPVNVNPGSDIMITSACAGRTPDEFFALSEAGDLYRIRTSDAKVRFVRNIMPGRDETVRDLAGCIGDRIYFHTDRDVYCTGLRLFSGIRRAGFPRREPKIISAAAGPDVGVMVTYADETFIMRTQKGTADTLRLGGDSYICAMAPIRDRAGKPTGMMVGTLNKGLYKTGPDGTIEKIEALGSEPGGIKDIVCIGNETAVLTPGKTAVLKPGDNGWTITEETAVPHETSGLFSFGGRLHAVMSTGGTFVVDDGSDILSNRDLRFLSSELDLGRDATDYGRELRLISENGCIFNPEDGSVTHAELRSPGASERLAKNKGGLWLVLSLAGLAAAAFGTAKHARIMLVGLKRWRTALGIIVLREQEISRLKEDASRRELLLAFEAAMEEYREMDAHDMLRHLHEDCRMTAEKGNAGQISRAAEALEQGRDTVQKALKEAEAAEEAIETVRMRGDSLPRIVARSAEKLAGAMAGMSRAGAEEIGTAAARFCAEYDAFSMSETLRNATADFTAELLQKKGISPGRHFTAVVLERLRAPEDTGIMLKKSLALTAKTKCLGLILEADDLMEEFMKALDGPGVMEEAKLKGQEDGRAEDERLRFYNRFNELAEEVYNALGDDEQAELKAARISGAFNSNDDYSETWMMILTAASGRMDIRRARWLCKKRSSQTNFDTAKSRLRKKLADYRKPAEGYPDQDSRERRQSGSALIVPVLLDIISERLGQPKRPQ